MSKVFSSIKSSKDESKPFLPPEEARPSPAPLPPPPLVGSDTQSEEGADSEKPLNEHDDKEIEEVAKEEGQDKNKEDEASSSDCPHLSEVERLLSETPSHLVSSEVLGALLRVQSKYSDEHPCFCTSRFRHVLHQQGQEEHRILADICGELKKLTSQSPEVLYQTSLQHYRPLASRIFDLRDVRDLRAGSEEPSGSLDSEAAHLLLLTKAEAVLARLVSDYRAIFAIEEEACARSDQHGDPVDPASGLSQHQQYLLDLHRKRHEEEDECPEEIKLMKVACEELSIECTASCDQQGCNGESSSDWAKDWAIICSSSSRSAKAGSLEPAPSKEIPIVGESKAKSAEPETTGDKDGAKKVQSGGNLTHYFNNNNNGSSDSLVNTLAAASSKCPRKRKEALRVEGEEGQHDRKFSRSSSNELWDDQHQPSSSNNHHNTNSTIHPLGDCCALKRCHSSSEVQELPSSALSERKIAHPRKPRKERSDSLKENKLQLQTKRRGSLDKQEVAVEEKNREEGEVQRIEKEEEEEDGGDKENPQTPPVRKSQHHYHHATIAVCNNNNNNNDTSEGCEPTTTARKKNLCASLSAPAPPPTSSSSSSVLRLTETHHQPVSWSPSRSASEPSSASSPLWMFNKSETEEEEVAPVSWEPSTSSEAWEEPPRARTPFSWMNRNCDSLDLSLPSSEFASVSSSSPASRASSFIHAQRYLDPSHSGRRRTSSTSSTGSNGSDESSEPTSTPRKTKLKCLRKQLSNVRRKLEELELGFEESQGYRPSQADKQTDQDMRQLLSEQSSLKKQIRSVKDGSSSSSFLLSQTSEPDLLEDTSNDSAVGSDIADVAGSWEGSKWRIEGSDSWRTSRDSLCDSSPEDSPRDLTSTGSSLLDPLSEDTTSGEDFRKGCLSAIRNSLLDMEQRLKAQRVMKGRPKLLEEMTAEQLVSEKADLQSALQDFEAVFGQPETEEAKALLKDFYDRYRTVKRLVRRSSAGRPKDQLQELETIPEHEALPFTLASPQHRIQIEVHGNNNNNGNNNNANGKPSGLLRIGKSVDLTELDKRSRTREVVSEEPVTEEVAPISEPPSEEENLHSLSRYELLQILTRTREEKKSLRRAIKGLEERFQRENGRRLLKEDREWHGGSEAADVYTSYKKTKAKLKLVDALLSKRVETFY